MSTLQADPQASGDEGAPSDPREPCDMSVAPATVMSHKPDSHKPDSHKPDSHSRDEPTPGLPGDGTLLSATGVRLGELAVRRLLPKRQRRTVGAWCFVDHYGPTSVDGGPGMQVPPHPHIGLQTVTWLFDGEVLHRDSLGNEQLIRPGQLNLMTAGRGIAHAEQSPNGADPTLHGLQLWVALPDRMRQSAPDFAHHAQLPRERIGGFDVTVFLGSHATLSSPAATVSELLGAELVTVRTTQNQELPLDPAFEHGVLVVAGSALVQRTPLAPGALLALDPGLPALSISATAGTRLILLGGRPFDEPLLMWWNFVARTADEIVTATRQWATGDVFGAVAGYRGAPLAAPELDAARLVARPPNR